MPNQEIPTATAYPRHGKPVDLLKPTVRESLYDKQAARARAPVPKRPLSTATFDRSQWEVSFTMDTDGINNAVGALLFPEIPDVVEAIDAVLLGKPYSFVVALRFEAPKVYISPRDRSKLVFEMPIQEGIISAPGFETRYKPDAKAVVELPIERVSLEVRWEDRQKANVLLDVDNKGIDIPFWIEGAPDEDLLGPIIKAANRVVKHIVADLPLDHRLVATVTIPDEAIEFADFFQDALPTRVFLALVRAKAGAGMADALAVRMICAGKHLAPPTDDLVFQDKENMALRISNGLLVEGTFIPALTYVFKNLQSAIQASAFVPEKDALGLHTKDTIKFDKFSRIAESPLFKDRPKIVEVLKTLAGYEGWLGAKLGFSLLLDKSDVSAKANGIVTIDKDGLAHFEFIVSPEVAYSLSFVREKDRTFLVAKPSRFDLNFESKNKSSFWEKVLQVLFITCVLPFLLSLLSLVLTYVMMMFLGLLGVLVTEAVEFAVVAILGKLIDEIIKVKEFLEYAHTHSKEIDKLVDKFNALGIYKITKDDLEYRVEVPATLEIAHLSRLSFTKCTDVYGMLRLDQPKPRPPKPLPHLVSIYQFMPPDGALRPYYSKDASAPEVGHPLDPYPYTQKRAYKASGPMFSAFDEAKEGCIPVYGYRIRVKYTGMNIWCTLGWIWSIRASAEEVRKDFDVDDLGWPHAELQMEGVSFYLPVKPLPTSERAILYRDRKTFGAYELLRASQKPRPGWEALPDSYSFFPIL